MNKYAEYVKATLDEREMFEQLAEECNELGQASLKVIRARGLSNNITPMSYGQALSNLREEMADVLLLIAMITGEDVINGMVDDIPYNPKLKRWAERLGYTEPNEAVADSLAEILEDYR